MRSRKARTTQITCTDPPTVGRLVPGVLSDVFFCDNGMFPVGLARNWAVRLFS